MKTVYRWISVLCPLSSELLNIWREAPTINSSLLTPNCYAVLYKTEML